VFVIGDNSEQAVLGRGEAGGTDRKALYSYKQRTYTLSNFVACSPCGTIYHKSPVSYQGSKNDLSTVQMTENLSLVQALDPDGYRA